MVDCVGQKLGNYRLIKLLGKGGFADVYQGEHVYLKTPAAIKVLQMQPTDEAFDKFLAEARTIARLTHPNIVPVLEFGIENDMPFLVMGYAPYGSLRQRHPFGSVLPAATILPYVKQVAIALQYAHERKIIHRDVKPENMLLGQSQVLMLSDFGIATTAHSMYTAPTQNAHTTSGTAGTATYMAPEQFNGKPCMASDQYALGVVVYEWFCGTPPFNGSPIEVAMQHLQALPPPMRAKVPTLAPAIERVLMRALAKDPELRFASVQDFAWALEEACLAASPFTSGPVPVRLPSLTRMSALNEGASGSLPTEEHASATVSDQFLDKAAFAETSYTPALPLQSALRSKGSISRRKVVAGMVGLGVVGLSTLCAGSLLHKLAQNQKAVSMLTPKITLNRTATAQAITNATIINATDTRPTVTSWGAGHLDMFIRGVDNALWHRSFDGSWHDWERLGGQLAYDPVVVSWSPGRFDLFVRGTNNDLQHKWFDGSWHDWESLGGLLTAEPAVTTWGPGQLHVFVRSLGNGLWYRGYDGSWHDWEWMGGVSSSDPALVSWAPGRLDAFVRGADNALWHKWFDGSWHDWESLGGIFMSDTTVASWGAGRLDVFVTGTDNTMMYKWFDITGWHDWESLEGQLTSSPTAISWGSGRIDVFARWSNNTLQHRWFDGVWHDWEPVG